MSYVVRNGCKLCNNLQFIHHIPKRSYYYKFYSKQNKLTRGISSCYNLYATNLHHKITTTDQSLYQAYVAEKRPPGQVVENTTMSDFKLHESNKSMLSDAELEETLFPEASSNLDSEIDNIVETVKKRRKRKEANISKYERGNQLTVYAEHNVLAEIDIYMYLGEFNKAEKVFNYHRRCGHRFSTSVYNKMINVWALQKNWKKIQFLLQNMRSEKVESNYQTYAGLLEACGNMDYDTHQEVQYILNEMKLKDLCVRELFRKSRLTKQQIASIRSALSLVEADCFDSDVDKQMPELNEFAQKQLDNEINGTLTIKSVETLASTAKHVVKRSNLYNIIIDQWKMNFILEMKKLRQTKDDKALLYNRCVTYTSVLSSEEIADIVFKDIVPLIASQQQGLSVSFICRLLGRMMYNRYCMTFKHEKGVVEKVSHILSEYLDDQHSGSKDAVFLREKWNKISETLDHLASEHIAPTPWSVKLKTMASSVVLDTLQKVAKVDTTLFLKNKQGAVEQSLFHGYDKIEDKKQRGMLRFHPAICRLYTSDLSHTGNISFEMESLPMTIPPKPWITPKNGGYLLLHTDLVRLMPGAIRERKMNNNEAENNIDDLLDAVSYIGNCAWKVNSKLLDIMIKLFNGSGNSNLDIIGKKMMVIAEENTKKKLLTRKEMGLAKKEFHECHALRMDLLYKLSVANHYRDCVIWNPNNLDFRGRIYPMAPHCSHIGNDVCRSMLMFAEGRKLGHKGLDWLKINLINVHGALKKASLQERINYANEHIDDVMDSADYPLTGRKWWQTGSDPWQTLVTCMEITDAIRSGDPSSFVSHLPVQQDGSCNGLQHYAALGRDSYGAKQVNLSPSDRPQDIYAEVSNLVEKIREEDAANGDLLAQQLVGKINRKVVKQTVMTVVYGVTFIGGRLQIEKQLKELDVDREIIFQASIYIVKLVFSSIGQMFTSARQLQDWLTLASYKISMTGNCVDWFTPMNLYVLQPYHKRATERVRTAMQTLYHSSQYDYTQAPNIRKQKGGFPPNFIHSLDSTHMLMTALQCRQEKMVFASVHDSFWTHACDTDQLNRFCREEFINLHNKPILTDLKKHFDEKYGGLPFTKPKKDESTVSQFQDLPELGDFDIKEVLKSVYFFS